MEAMKISTQCGIEEKSCTPHIRWNITLPAAATMMHLRSYLGSQLDRERRAYDLTYRWDFNINRNEITSETHRHKYQANSYQRKKVQWKDLLEASE